MSKIRERSLAKIRQELEYAYSGAEMLGDTVSMLRLARAIAALNAPVDMDIFTDEFKMYSASH